jgi:predicted ATP-dependent protease
MKPEPVTAETTVILVGPARIYESLCAQDDEFLKLFKVAAEFSPVMPREPETEKEYASFASGLAVKEGLLPITDSGIREIISYGVVLSEKRNRLSTRFSLIGDLIRESHYGAEKEGKTTIDGTDVKKAIASRKYLSNLPEQMLMNQIREGTLLIDVDGRNTGVVNGLAVLERGFYAFGTPLRITVAVGPGKDGVINIERESGLSGELHDKGIFLLEGYLRHRYARRQPLSLTASIAVEQSYYEIDGDSASAAELAALLSAIAEIPLRQDVAVTGAVNQQGIIQPIGGIFEKVQGFFQACEAKGLTGRQGVVVPAKNIESVILPDEIIEAVKASRFHIWIAETIDEIMSLLTGWNAGKERRNGKFENHSINERIRRGLTELADYS